MDVQKSTLEFGGKEIHVVTDSEVVKYGSGTVKDALDSIPTSSSFMESLLACTDADQVRKLLKMNQQILYDYAGNRWEVGGGSPVVGSNNVEFNDGAAYVYTTLQNTPIVSTQDFSIDCVVRMTATASSSQACACGYNTLSNAPRWHILFTSSNQFSCSFIIGSNTYTATSSSTYSLNTDYWIQVYFDSSNNSINLYVNGTLQATKTATTFTKINTVNLGRSSTGSSPASCIIKKFRISDCYRSSQNFTLDSHTRSLINFA